MPYLIDGHNLIPKLGMRLDALDDESELIAILQEFCRLERRQVEVFFDGAPSSQAGTRKLGAVTATFSPLGSPADNAIRNRLKKLGKAAKNYTVVTSDREVQSSARVLQADVVSSDEFAKSLKQVMNSPRMAKGERVVSKEEVDEWMKMFGGKKKETED
ncbi:MAG: NYN domain-containing protein [Anaerolineales bacterium]|nr:NYN domain-containing protein [Anaerolineales bacterium]MCL4261145.1 NYN domain-containing protein [Anaerolineales bacterium]